MMKDSVRAAQALSPAYRRLRQSLSQIGWVALGSLVERNKPGQGGPRYQWSRRVGRKTVTVALSAEQFQWMKQAIKNQRTTWKILARMQDMSVKFLMDNLPNPKKRKPRNERQIKLN